MGLYSFVVAMVSGGVWSPYLLLLMNYGKCQGDISMTYKTYAVDTCSTSAMRVSRGLPLANSIINNHQLY